MLEGVRRMLGSPRIVAIDDQEEHLAGLADCLNRNGVACLRIRYTGDSTEIKPCPDVRVIFADLQLVPGPRSDHLADFAGIGSLLEGTIKPTGPYFIVLWTQYPNQASGLLEFLTERLGPGVTKPYDVRSLPKSRHIDRHGNIGGDKLMEEVADIARDLPQLGALFDWEGRVLRASGRTVSSILDVASTGAAGERSERLSEILGHLGVEAVGRDHVERDRFRAVNDALHPILGDRISKTGVNDDDDELWRAALEIPDRSGALAVEDAAKLNRLVHIADPGNTPSTARGAVVPLPDSRRPNFQDQFGIVETEAAGKRFRCKDFDPDSSSFRWVLVQCQAACDFAQSNPGSLPYYLGLDFPEKHRATSGNPPKSTWRGPVFELQGEIRRLRVSAGFPVALLTSELQGIEPLYRLREQMLNDLVYHLHSHGARPGMMSFGKK